MDDFAATQDEHTKDPVAPVAVGPYCALVRVKAPCWLCGCATSATRHSATHDERLCIDHVGCNRRMARGG